MKNNRKAVIVLTHNRIPVYEGDIVKVFFSKDGTANIHWYPKSCDF
jgi:hypothetical protein